MNQDTIAALKEYFSRRDDVVLAFLFGSQTKGLTRTSSDWDIALYLAPRQWGELDTDYTYNNESDICADISRMIAADVDCVILNRAHLSLVFSILNTGVPLANKDMKLYFTLLSRTHYDAVDYWNFVHEYRSIYERAASLTPEARALLLRHLTFLENEFTDADRFSVLSRKDYLDNRDTRRNVERWIENCVMSTLDIAKIILASERRDIPQTYKDMLREFGELFVGSEFAERFSEITSLRNILAHEYLDLRWKRIEHFLKNAQELYTPFTAAVKKYLND